MNITEIQLCSPGPNYTSVMFTTDTFENDYITHAVLPVRNVNPNAPYVLRNASGLDAQEIVRTYNDGPQFFRQKPKERIVSLQIRLNPDYSGGLTIGDLRDSIYKAIAMNTKGSQQSVYGDVLPNKMLELRFMNGTTHLASLFGTIQKLEGNLFSDQPDLVLELFCDDPFLRSTIRQHGNDNIDDSYTGTHVVNGNTYNVDSRFTLEDPLSTAPHGFAFHAICTGTVDADPEGHKLVIVWDERDVDHYVFVATFDFAVGDKLHFNSNESDRNLFVQRDTTTFFGLMTSIYTWGSVWPMLMPGSNAFQISKGFRFSAVSHAPAYWGV